MDQAVSCSGADSEKFAKHFKLSEHIKMLEAKGIGIGVGTPTRLIDLANDGMLPTSRAPAPGYT